MTYDKKWDWRFINLAREYASWSKDPSKKIGAVAVRNKRVISQGFNGFPKGIEDSEERLSNREIKYKYVIHAEANCLINAAYEGVSLDKSTLYVHGLPVCSECAKLVIQSGVKRVVMFCEDVSDKWVDSFKTTEQMFKEASIEYEFLQTCI